MKTTVYIQANEKQYFCAKISRYSIQSSASKPVDVKILKLEDFPQLTQNQGKTYLRKDLEETWENDTLQSFTPLRFLPPQVQGFHGRALVIDPDVFALTDIWNLLDRDMKGKAILCNYDEVNGKKSYKTSVMLLDCEKLNHWKWDQNIEDLFKKKFSYRDWMSLKLEDPSTIGFFEKEWNHMDSLSNETKMIHYTKKVTQPWKTGLKIDFIPDKLPPKWGFIPRELTVGIKGMILGGFWKEKAAKVYLDNPHNDQKDLFWKFAAKALKDNIYQINEAKEQIDRGNIRPDFLKLVERYS